MKIKVIILMLICAAPLINFAQGINNYKLKISNKAEQLFSQVKNDSNYIEYVQIIGTFASSFAKKDSVNTKADTVNTSIAFQSMELKAKLRSIYPLWKQLNAKEERYFIRLSAKYYKQLNGLSP
jgi:hypothetical protein